MLEHEAGPRRRVLMVSDFFYPNVGGVENHVYMLSQCLLNAGHHVVIATHAYGKRTGVRYLTNGLKVYYLPRRALYLSVTAPTLFGTFRLLRNIIIREQIQIVHSHQAFSVLGNEAALHTRTLGLPVVFTDHSLFGFADASSIATNKLLKWTLCDVQAVICVSHTSKENTVLRACVPPARVYAIPNAVDMAKFKPFPRPDPEPGTITLIMLSRLFYRKGVDLAVAILPTLCRKYPQLRVIIGGDGPMGVDLEHMIATYSLENCVSLVGPVRHEDVCQHLVQGDIFLNTSLTEAFCMAIVEAAACGLLVTSTNVGGIPEVLPSDTAFLADPDPCSLLVVVCQAIERLKELPVDRQAQHDRVRYWSRVWNPCVKVAEMYNWTDVASRTEVVYSAAIAQPHSASLAPRLPRLLACGKIYGLLVVAFAALSAFWHAVVCWLDPEDDIDKSPGFNDASAACIGTASTSKMSTQPAPAKRAQGLRHRT